MEFEERSAEGIVLEPLVCWPFVAAAISQTGGVFTRKLSEDIPLPPVLWNQQVTTGARARSLITKTLKAKS
jgi:short subunit dehydrogenase-like uncharacterized protein